MYFIIFMRNGSSMEFAALYRSLTDLKNSDWRLAWTLSASGLDSAEWTEADVCMPAWLVGVQRPEEAAEEEGVVEREEDEEASEVDVESDLM